MTQAYLTIDDSPSEHFRDLIDFLEERKIPAAFFCRGDLLEQRPNPVAEAIQKGFVIGNHGYHHSRASDISFEEICDDIRRAEDVIASLYSQAGVKRLGKYFRFPYMDRGMGPWLVEPENLPEDQQLEHHALVQQGLGHALPSPSQVELCNINKKRELQEFLQKEGFEPLPTPGVTLPFFADTEMAEAFDTLCTFSTSDWALTTRHKGQHGYQTIDDLKEKIDNDPTLKDQNSAHILLAHDQTDIFEVTTALIDHCLDQGFEFLGFHDTKKLAKSA